MTPDVKLRVRGLSKTYRTRNGLVHALCDVNMEVGAGEFVCVVGQSGCGKTTLLNLIAGFERPDHGTIEICNTHGQVATRKLVIFQEPSLFPWLTVRGNVEFGLRMARIDKRRRDELVDEHLALVGLSDFSESYVHQLSGGMKQRAVLARALVLEPDILLMDEPFAALDAQTKANLHGELLRIVSQTGKTILFITHSIDEAVFLADRILVFTPQPGTCRQEFDVSLPKPRSLESQEARSLTNDITRALGLGGVLARAMG